MTATFELPPSPRVSASRRRHVERIISSLIDQKPLRIILFGSWARGQADNQSDLDLVVIKQTPARFVRRLDDWHFPVQMGVDVLVYTPEEFEAMRQRGNPFVEQVLREGVTVYARPN